jgi:hypothetical protein
MQQSFTFRRGEDIDQREAGLDILQKYWKAFAPRNTEEWGLRIANSGGYIVAAYVDNVIAGILEGMRLDTGGDPFQVPNTFRGLTADGTWKTHRDCGDTVMLVDLTIAPNYHGSGLFEAFVQFAHNSFQSPSGVIFTYSPLFCAHNRYWVVQKHERLGAKLMRELPRSRPGLTMTVAGKELMAEDVAITGYTV